VRTCLLFTEKQASPNALPEMNINSTPTPSWYVQIQHGLYTDICKTDERHVLSSFWFEIGDFVFQDESKKTLSICKSGHFSRQTLQRYVFYSNMTLFSWSFLPLHHQVIAILQLFHH